MPPIPRSRAGRTGGARRLALLAIAAVLGLVAAAVVVVWGWERRTPPHVVGAPLRVTTPAGDALFLLTHHETIRPHRTGARGDGLLRRARTLHVELWRLDVPTGRVAWRRPLLAWLGVQAQRAEQAGATDEAQRLRRRMALAAGER